MNDQEIINFAGKLDRSFFIDNENKALAGINEPLPIGFGQTISQPSLVVEMSQLLTPGKDRTVLEIGTGSGYQTAILAHFSKHVYTVERIPELGRSARTKLEALGYSNISYRIGDGSDGWIEHAPYDRIIVTAAAQRMPQELLDQLKENGIMIIPIGPRGLQQLMFIKKNPDGEIRTQSVEYVRFVEMKGKYGWSEN
ncbi:MAG: protein-L-isoaspartate(D-aspartate) O-methyltransferase [Eubacteriales bacterium]